MDRKTLFGTASVAAALLLGGAWWLAQSRATSPPMSPVPPEMRPAEEALGAAQPAVAQDVAASPDLPPPPPMPVAASTPPAPATTTAAAAPAPIELLLRDEIADLDRRAREGDAGAACRLGAELLRCERARTMQPYTDNVEAQARAMAQRSLPPEEVDRQIDAALQRQAENAAALARCEGVDETRWPVPARYFQLAAQAGHRPSMIQFLNADRFRADQLFRDPELIPLFRTHAPRYFMQLLQEGDVELLQRWAMGSIVPHDILQDVLPPPYNDAGFAMAVQQQMLLARGIQPPTSVPVRDPPTAEQMAEAERLYSRYFAARRPDRDELRRRYGASPYDLDNYRCDEAPRGVVTAPIPAFPR